MSETQSITYSTGLNAVAVDSVGNLVTDSVGNLVIPIEPILLFPSAGSPRSDGAEPTGCQTITVTLNGNHTETFRFCDSEDRVVGDVGIVNGRSGLTLNMRTLQKKFGDTVTLSVAIQTHFKRKWNKVTDEEGNVIEYCSQYTSYGHDMSVTWNGKTIDGESVYRCGGAVHVGKVTIDFNSATVSLDTSAMPDSMLGAECGGCYGEPPVEIITVKCDSKWCNGSGNIRYRGDGWLWDDAENEVEVRIDQTPDDAIAENTNAIKISGVESKQWISTRYPEWAGGKRFWRDWNKDTEPGSGGWKRHVVYGAWASTSLRDEVFSKHQSGIAFFCTTPPPDEQGTETTVNEVYGWAGAPNDYANLEYATNNQRKDAPLMDGEFKWHRDGGDDWEWPDDRFVHVLDYNRGYTDGYTTIKRVLNRTGNTVIVPEGSRHSGKWFEYVTTPIDGYPQITVWLQYEYMGGGFPTNNWAFINTTPNSDGTGWVDDAIIGGETAWLEHNGWRYVYDYYGLLFDSLSYHAWTLSPCHQEGVSPDQITVYTDPKTLPEDIIAGDKGTTVYVRYENDYDGDNEIIYWPEGKVTATGSHDYVLETVSGNKWYWSEDLTISTIDEEFE